MSISTKACLDKFERIIILGVKQDWNRVFYESEVLIEMLNTYAKERDSNFTFESIYSPECILGRNEAMSYYLFPRDMWTNFYQRGFNYADKGFFPSQGSSLVAMPRAIEKESTLIDLSRKYQALKSREGENDSMMNFSFATGILTFMTAFSMDPPTDLTELGSTDIVTGKQIGRAHV